MDTRGRIRGSRLERPNNGPKSAMKDFHPYYSRFYFSVNQVK